ncbi:MAG TPA: FAD binding domain-containing protein [Polyangiaceae bacterium]|jgi:xanthine dehydrogenase small subunit|nr:FAD binding domain-containing protein [Polyangiaceae bacterium]
MTLRFVLNGHEVETEATSTDVSLLTWLRARGLTGTKEGCAEGECGACAVAMLRTDVHGRTRFEAVNGCLVPLSAVHGRTVVTVEGVANPDGTLHPVQTAMVNAGGSQCGYCTPGFVVSLFCEYYRPGRTSVDLESIGGNLCRCTGYRPILDVARALPSPEATDPTLAVLESAVPPEARVEPSSRTSRFARPTELDEAFRLLEAHPEATLISGGTDLMVVANAASAPTEKETTWLSLTAIAELRRFEVTDEAVVIGAGLPLADLEELLPEKAPGAVPLLEQLLPLFSSRLIRNRATLGGNLGTASPIGDSPPVLLALDARVGLASKAGRREVPLATFFLDYRKTLLERGELITHVVIPRPVPALQRFYKVSKRVLDDISTVAAAFALDLTRDHRVAHLRIAYGGVAATPLRALAVEDRAYGQPWTRATLEALLPLVERLGTPMTDMRGSAAYRRAMLSKLLEKFFHDTAPAAKAAE